MRQTYKDFEAEYVEPSYFDFIRSKVRLPKWNEIVRDFGEPMSENDVERFKEAVDPEGKFPEDVRSMMRFRARTKTGHYLYALYVHFRYVFTGTFRDFKEIHFENAYNSWSYSNDDY